METASKKLSEEQDQVFCPASVALNLISRKWSLHILMPLLKSDKPIRFGELQRSIAGISQRELTKHLREFEDHGIVSRTVFPQVPPRVEYELTETGKSLMEPITALHQWAEKYGAVLHKTRSNLS